MLVLIAGMHRSGSTFSFNIAREALSTTGSVHHDVANNLLPLLNSAPKAAHFLLKSHGLEEDTLRLVEFGAFKTVVTVRRPEDAIASFIETFGFTLDNSIAVVNGWMKYFERLRPYSLVLPYELINEAPLEAAWKITSYLTPGLSRADSDAIAAQYNKADLKAKFDQLSQTDQDVSDIGFSYYDQKTFFHRRHISSVQDRSAIERIGEEAVLKIRHSLSQHIDENGNWRDGIISD